MSTSRQTATTTIGTTCTNYAGGQVTITVPSSGTVFVQAQTWLLIDHASGTEDRGGVVIGNSATDCTDAAYLWPVVVPAAEPTYVGLPTPTFVQRPFPVTAGTYTFYLNGYMTTGQDAQDVFWFGNMVAVFYPS